MEGIERGKFIILCLILCSFLTVSPVWAATGDVTICSPGTNPAQGDTFEVPVTVDAGINPFGAYNFTVTYDASVVNVQGIAGGTAAEFSSDPFANPAAFSSGATPFNAFNSTSMTLPTGAVNVANITFKVVGNPGDTSVLHINVISLSDSSGSQISPTKSIDGSVTVQGGFVPVPTLSQWGMIILCLLLGLASIVMIKKKRESAFIIAFLIAASLFMLMEGSVRAGILGDANADSDVNIDDADFISRFLVGLVPSLPNPDDADVNGDGKVDIIDAMIIAQYANHLRDELPLTVDSPPTAIGTATPSTGPAPLNVNFNGTGTDPDGTIVLYEWKFTSHGTYDYSSATSAATSHTYNEPDKYIAVFRVTDDDGLIDTDSVLISVSGPPISKPGAFPTSGKAPLTVTFFANGEDLDGSPEYYDWDFNGDGVKDKHLIASMNTEHTFTQAGTYNATLTVTDNEGLTGSASIPITVSEGTNPQGYPIAIAAATPSNGGAPLPVTLVGKGTDEDGTINKLEWDFEGDGVFDFVDTVVPGGTLGEMIDAGSYSSPDLVDIDNDGDLDLFIGESEGSIHFYRNDGDSSTPIWTSEGLFTDSSSNALDVGSYSSPDFVDIDGDDDYDAIIGNSSGYIYLYSTAGCVTHIYSTPGIYEATLRVTDNDDQIATDSVTITVLKTGTPTATASANPTSGNFPLEVSFNGTGRDKDGTITLYEWDFDGDGIYDWSNSASGNTSHTYNNVGSYVATLRVTDNEGKTSTDSITIFTNLGIAVTRTAIFDPVSGGAGSVNSTITGDSIVTVKVIDQSGNAVRTLADNESRTAGTYTDTWDGKDEASNIVRDGVYYFLIEHTENGKTQTFDLRETAQYRELDPGRTWPSTFNPYKEDYVQVTYSIPYPAEVSMYFWKRDSSHPGSSIAPVRTMFIRKPKDAGSHTEIWDGVDDKGTVVGNWSGGYCITLWTYELPSNAIIITGNTPIITDVGAAPNLFSPAYNPYGSTEPNYTVVSFNLSEAANVEVKIKNTNGVTVKSFNKTDLPAGANNIIWDGKDFDDNLVKDGS